MPITVSDVIVVIEVEDAKFYFEPITLADLFEIPALGKEGLVDKGMAAKAFLELLPRKLKKWENIIDSSGKPLECTPENFKRLPGGVAIDVITKFTDLMGLSGEFEKNSGKPSK